MRELTWVLRIILTIQTVKMVKMTSNQLHIFPTSPSATAFSFISSVPKEQRSPSKLATSSTTLGPVVGENESLAGLSVECGADWRLCLLLGRLLHRGRCYPPSAAAPCGGNGSLLLDAGALRQGRLRAVCAGNGSLCGGAWACPGEPEPQEQPEEAGRCVLPDLAATQGARRFRVECSLGVLLCLRQGLLPLEGACYAPLSNATCAEGEWLVLNESAAEAGLLSGMCAPRRPCGEEALRLLASGRCHSEEQVRESLCPGSWLFYSPTGDVVCSEDPDGSGAAITVVAECGNEETGIDSEEGDSESTIQDTEVTTENELEIVLPDVKLEFAVTNQSLNCPRDNSGTCAPQVNPL